MLHLRAKLLFLVGAVASFSFAGEASAADMPLKAMKAPPPVIDDGWTGYYVGLNAGGIWGSNSLTAVPADPGTTAFWAACFAAGACPRNYGPNTNTSAEVGGQLGYNWQMKSFVLGVETDFQWTDVKSSSAVSLANTGTGFVPFTGTASSKLEWFGTTRGRLGFLATPNLLLYGSGGVAYGSVANSWTAAFAATNQNVVGSGSDTRVGWVAGAGAEWKWTRNWIVGLEYLHMELDSSSFRASGVGSAGCTALNCNFNVGSDHFKSDTVRARLSYQFSGPPFAR